MKHLALVLALGAVLLLPPRPASATLSRIEPSDVRRALLASHWTPAAADWAATHVLASLDTTMNGGGGYTTTAPPETAPYVWVGVGDAASSRFLIEHEMHHAWDDAHQHQTDADRIRDAERLAGEPTPAGQWARETLALGREPGIAVHYGHILIDKATAAGQWTTAFPPWFRDASFGYLEPLTRRTLLPLVHLRAPQG